VLAAVTTTTLDLCQAGTQCAKNAQAVGTGIGVALLILILVPTIAWLVSMCVGFRVGRRKGRGGLGFLLGLLFNIFGVIAIAVIDPKRPATSAT
jgi:hypothetical protein